MLNRTMNHKDMNNAVKGFLESLEEHGVNDYTTLLTISRKLSKELWSDKYAESRAKHKDHYYQVYLTRCENMKKKKEAKEELLKKIDSLVEEYCKMCNQPWEEVVLADKSRLSYLEELAKDDLIFQ